MADVGEDVGVGKRQGEKRVVAAISTSGASAKVGRRALRKIEEAATAWCQGGEEKPPGNRGGSGHMVATAWQRWGLQQGLRPRDNDSWREEEGVRVPRWQRRAQLGRRLWQLQRQRKQGAGAVEGGDYGCERRMQWLANDNKEEEIKATVKEGLTAVKKGSVAIEAVGKRRRHRPSVGGSGDW
ncbi:hypothetical protein GW17_00036873 [Ensete ventricosum]|nr:hypothetical protein GW17_00036873 [Ensete ventricosum]